MPEPPPAELARIREARQRIRQREPRQIAGVLSRLAEQWLLPSSPWMHRAVTVVENETSFSRPMIEAMLPRMIEPLAGDAIERLVQREIGSWESLQRASAPELILHVLPSNLPAHAAIPSALSLLLRSAVLLKPGRADRGFTELWVESIGELDRDLADCVAAVYWRGGDGTADELLEAADLVVAAGGDRAIEDLRRRTTGRFIGHGHRLSFAVVGADADLDRAAQALAEDVSAWDQLGCLSPQMCFVGGGIERARDLAQRASVAMQALARALPAGRLSEGELLAVRDFRDAARWRGFAGGGQRVFADNDPGGGTVVLADEASFEPTPLHRCLRIAAAETPDIRRLLDRDRPPVESAGVAAGPKSAEVQEQLRDCGVPRVVGLGKMQRPALEWRQSGRPRLADWLAPPE